VKRAAASAAVVALLLAALSACASSPKKPGTGFRTLEATVIDRQYDPPGSGGASYRGNGNYYLVFETRDGDATATFKFEVTKIQYNRYTEGSRVRIVLADNDLRDIKPIQ
jgi:hypothetical protein